MECQHNWQYTMDHIYWCANCGAYKGKDGKVFKS